MHVAETSHPPLVRRKILVVDDEEIIRRLITRLLERDHVVETASDGREALERLAAESYDVALVDLGIPGIPGNVVAQRLRERARSTAIVLISGWVLEVDDSRLSVFDLRLQKPFSPTDLLDVLQRAGDLHDERMSSR